MMGCFDFRSRITDYIEDALPIDEAQLLSQHLKSCNKCTHRLEHFNKLAEMIAAQPKKPMPANVRKSPLAPLATQSSRSQFKNSRSRWERAPWFVRTGVEGMAIAVTILLVVVMVPKLRSLYEQRLEHRLDDYGLEEIDSNIKAESEEAAKIPMARGRVTKTPEEAEEKSEDFTGGEANDSEEGEIRVGNSEIWRFNIKTASPEELRIRVVQMLSELRLSPETPGLGGTKVPGGIQFDLLIPKGLVGTLRSQLKKLSAAEDRVNNTEKEIRTFTWYKDKSRRKIPDGRARVVIWLSLLM